MDAIEYPKVTIGGRTYTLRFSMLAKYQMSKLGIRGSDFRALGNPTNPDPAIVSLVVRLFACAVADNFVDPDRPAAPVEIPTPEYWASQMPEDKDAWAAICTATMQALVKAIPPTAALPLVEAATGQQPN